MYIHIYIYTYVYIADIMCRKLSISMPKSNSATFCKPSHLRRRRLRPPPVRIRKLRIFEPKFLGSPLWTNRGLQQRGLAIHYIYIYIYTHTYVCM